MAGRAVSLDLRSIYAQEADRVFGFLSRFGLSGADLEDAVHDTFVTALSRAGSYDPSRPAGPWVLGIAFRVAVARVRSAKEHTAEIPDTHDPSQNPERAVEARQAQRLVQRAVSELSAEQGTVFVLYDLQGVSVADISKSMNVPVKTTYSRLRLARQAFQAAVERIRNEERVQ
jgi:RNA polymerase sigma-70 factor (ECF subfamily)